MTAAGVATKAGLVFVIVFGACEFFATREMWPGWFKLICIWPGPLLDSCKTPIPTGTFETDNLILVHDHRGIRARHATDHAVLVRVWQTETSSGISLQSRWGPSGVTFTLLLLPVALAAVFQGPIPGLISIGVIVGLYAALVAFRRPQLQAMSWAVDSWNSEREAHSTA